MYVVSLEQPMQIHVDIKTMTRLLRIIVFITCVLSTTPEVVLRTEPTTYIKNASDLKNNSNDTTAKHLDLKQRRQQINVNLLFNTVPTGKKTRFARSAYRKRAIGTPELQPEGYMFDNNNCQYVDDRVLCGYDNNLQEPRNKDHVDLDDNCRKRGDKIECGYVNGPFPDPYNPDPKNDKIANIDLTKYFNNTSITRSGGKPNIDNKDDTDDDNYSDDAS